MGWLFRRRRASADVTRLKDPWAVRSIRLQHRGYPAVAVGVGLVVPAFVAAQWGDPWGGLLVAGFLRAAAMLLDGAFEKCRVSEFGDRLAQDARVTALDETVISSGSAGAISICSSARVGMSVIPKAWNSSAQSHTSNTVR